MSAEECAAVLTRQWSWIIPAAMALGGLLVGLLTWAWFALWRITARSRSGGLPAVPHAWWQNHGHEPVDKRWKGAKKLSPGQIAHQAAQACATKLRDAGWHVVVGSSDGHDRGPDWLIIYWLPDERGDAEPHRYGFVAPTRAVVGMSDTNSALLWGITTAEALLQQIASHG